MYSYSICTEPDYEIFTRQCKALEKNIPGLVKVEKLEDVDGSQIQVYKLESQEISVYNSYYVGAVYIESEVDLEKFF